MHGRDRWTDFVFEGDLEKHVTSASIWKNCKFSAATVGFTGLSPSYSTIDGFRGRANLLSRYRHTNETKVILSGLKCGCKQHCPNGSAFFTRIFRRKIALPSWWLFLSIFLLFHGWKIFNPPLFGNGFNRDTRWINNDHGIFISFFVCARPPCRFSFTDDIYSRFSVLRDV